MVDVLATVQDPLDSCCHLTDTVQVGPARLHKVTFDQAIALIETMIECGRSHHVVTLNLDLLWWARRDAAFLQAIRTADLNGADGVPLIWLSKLAREPLPERINGTDLVWALADLSQRRGYRLFLMGAGPGVAADAVERLRAHHPRLVLAGVYSPPMGEWDQRVNDEILAKVVEAAPHILLVGLGSPRQEVWIHNNLEALGVSVCVGIGGSFDLIAGRVPRAPQWMQRSGLEWLHRLCSEPRRLWRRYVVRNGPLFISLLLWAMMRRFRSRRRDQ